MYRRFSLGTGDAMDAAAVQTDQVAASDIRVVRQCDIDGDCCIVIVEADPRARARRIPTGEDQRRGVMDGGRARRQPLNAAANGGARELCGRGRRRGRR